MNRKNLTAAVLAGLAGVAGMAGAAQAGISSTAVNMNPDGLGEVLLYPYYTTNDDNATLITVVNTTDFAKAVKVRFLEAYNSREVLDFNLYLSPWDVWVAALADSSAFGAAAGVPHLFTRDTSCTVPYIYGAKFNEDLGGGLQPFLDFAYSGDAEDGGPTDISRASEGYFEIIEMGVMTDGDEVEKGDVYGTKGELKFAAGRIGSATAATHVIKEDDDGNEYVEPEDCQLLVDNWTIYSKASLKPHPLAGWWRENADVNCDGEEEVGDDDCGQADNNHPVYPDLYSTTTNSGGLFGGAAIINVPKGTMFSYDAKAIQGFDTTDDGLHFLPGTIHPSLNDGSTDEAIVFLGGGNFKRFDYKSDRTVDAISAVFMHDTLSNTFVIEEDIDAATEWVMTLPTKAWYVDTSLTDEVESYYIPGNGAGCFGWEVGDDNPFPPTWEPGDPYPEGWENCIPVKVTDENALAPFSEPFGGESCDEVSFRSWDREESPTVEGGVIIPPIVSPAPPAPPDSEETPFELCYEVNVLRFGEGSVFGTDSDILYTVDGTADAGWARITMSGLLKGWDVDLEEYGKLIGLPITGFSAEQYTNGTLPNGVLANYGGLFGHKGSVCYRDFEGTDCNSDLSEEF